MSSLAELPVLVGFFSYSREDDEAFRGALSALRDGIQRELSAQLGRNKRTLQLWQDVTALAPGKLWESEITAAISGSFFFIPIVTPRSVASKYCVVEFNSFLAREKAIGRNDLVFPIHYISVPALENEAKWRADPVLSIIGQRQYVDWRPLRHVDPQSYAVRDQIERFCQKIVAALNEPWISPEERQRMEAAEAQRAEEARRLKAEEEQRRKAEEERQRKLKEESDRLRAEEALRLKAEEERQQKLLRLKAEEEQRLKDDKERLRKLKEDADRLSAEEALRRAEDERRLKADEERQRKLKEQADRQRAEAVQREAERQREAKAEENPQNTAEERRRKAEVERQKEEVNIKRALLDTPDAAVSESERPILSKASDHREQKLNASQLSPSFKRYFFFALGAVALGVLAIWILDSLTKSPSHIVENVPPKADQQTPAKDLTTEKANPASSALTNPVAQRVVLYDEDPSDPKGKQYVGSVIWRTEPIKASGNQKPDVAVRAHVEIPDRKFKMTMSIRRNNDPSLPASHTVEVTFILPPDFVGGGVGNVPGILMKSNEQARGTPLAGLAVKVTDGFFLVGLSNVDTDRARNLQLLKERSWFDMPMVYVNQRRAIIAIEKGAPGERALNDAFAVWGD